MGEKAATKEVIEALINAVGHKDCYVGRAACETLWRMGEKAATKEAIEALISAVGDKNYYVRGAACEALGQMGEKAAAKEVTEALTKAVGDKNDGVRSSASKALGLLRYNASGIECLQMSIILDSEGSHECGGAFEWLLAQPSFRKFHERVVRNVTLRLMGVAGLSLSMVPVKELSLCIVDQPGSDWSNLVTYVCIINCVAVIQNGEGIKFVSEKGHETAAATNGRLRVKFVKELVEWKKKQGLLPQEDFAASSVCVLL
ncbi:unnamed protein product [Rotaria magnacalcarata]|nr:unnamed protein product [Rotaria magnacalcarata]CAF3927082.1 unnamed protein product [Rotaria magnacalcarata]